MAPGRDVIKYTRQIRMSDAIIPGPKTLLKDAASAHLKAGMGTRNPTSTPVRKRPPSQTASQSSCRHHWERGAGAWGLVAMVLVAMGTQVGDPAAIISRNHAFEETC